MEEGNGSDNGAALSKRPDGRLLITTAALAAVCLLVVAGSVQLGRHPGAASIKLYANVVSQLPVLGMRGAGGTCAAAVAVPKARASWSELRAAQLSHVRAPQSGPVVMQRRRETELVNPIHVLTPTMKRWQHSYSSSLL